MPAVQVEPSHPAGDARWELTDRGFRERLASAVVDAVGRFFAGPAASAPTQGPPTAASS
jgi:hypothetical protein